MDPGKIIEIVQVAGPGAGLGLAIGLLFFILGLPAKKWVMWGQFEQMKNLYDKSEREKRVVELDRDGLRIRCDELRIMLVSSIGVNRKSAHLASSLLRRFPEDYDEPTAHNRGLNKPTKGDAD